MRNILSSVHLNFLLQVTYCYCFQWVKFAVNLKFVEWVKKKGRGGGNNMGMHSYMVSGCLFKIYRKLFRCIELINGYWFIEISQDNSWNERKDSELKSDSDAIRDWCNLMMYCRLCMPYVDWAHRTYYVESTMPEIKKSSVPYVWGGIKRNKGIAWNRTCQTYNMESSVSLVWRKI